MDENNADLLIAANDEIVKTFRKELQVLCERLLRESHGPISFKFTCVLGALLESAVRLTYSFDHDPKATMFALEKAFELCGDKP